MDCLSLMLYFVEKCRMFGRVYIMLWPNFPESAMDQETESKENNQVIRAIYVGIMSTGAYSVYLLNL